MKLLFLDSIETQTFGGMEEWIRLVAAGLVERGHAITVAGRPGSQFLERLSASKTGAELLPLDISGDFHPVTITKLTRYLKRHEIDLVIVNFNKDLRLGGLAARLEGGARVVWSVGLDITKDSFVHRFLTPRLVDGVIVPSQSLKSQITRLGYIAPEMVEVIPIGIPDQPHGRDDATRQALRHKYHLAEDAIVAIGVGRFVEQKGHRYLLEAMPLLVHAYPNLRFLWCGDGPLETALRQRAAELEMTDRLIFAGMLPDIGLELGGSDLMIHPSVEEPFGIAILEGMRAGLPIVASRVGGIPDVLGNAGLLVSPRLSEVIYDAVARLLANRDFRSELCRKARLRYEQHFQQSVMLDHIETYFTSVLHAEQRHG